MERLMNVRPTALDGVVVVEAKPLADQRGTFARLYCDRELEAVIQTRRVVQINHSQTTAVGAVRGLHYQNAPNAEMKLVRCLRGRVWDVAVDLRSGSPTFLKWHAEELTPANRRMLVIPEGCAHGFQVLEPNSELLYLHTDFYKPEAEGAVHYDDPSLRITWPLPVADLSDRDRRHPIITSNFPGLSL
jgi:dTDP-4-dehydrorhamnose 3,5-epimerase